MKNNKLYSTNNTKGYCREVLAMLKDFGVTCTLEQKKHLFALPTEEAVDRYKKQLIASALKEDK